MAKKKRSSKPLSPKRRSVKRRDRLAAALRTPQFRSRVVVNAKTYSRKGKAPSGEEE